MSNGKGRPVKGDKKSNRIIVRLTDRELSEVLGIVSETGESYSDVVRKALKLYYLTSKNGD